MRAHLFPRLPLAAVLALAAGAFLQIAACAHTWAPPPAPPPPAPVVGPVEPPAPIVTPDGHRVTQADLDAIPMGSGTDLVTLRLGMPWQRSRLESEGVDVWVYRAITEADPTRHAEVWFKSGKVVNKVIF